MSFITRTARLVAWTGLTAAGAIHAVWASGSSWPERNHKRLGEAVVGNGKQQPDAQATMVVSGLAFAGGAVAAGGLGEGKFIVGVRRVAGLALIARAAFGGAAALQVLGLDEPGKRFEELDRRYYRPAFGILGAAMLLGAKDSKKRAAKLALKQQAH
ncbi:hypothetical protein ACIFOC_00346 [Leucobacter aridicollis]|uniref:DUF3995 domain-containing protein n=1 Tax=Leucobacter aridicollis TaxID=283878 RepID=UPI0037CB6E40